MSVKSIERLEGRETVQGSGVVRTASRAEQGFRDKTGINPRPEYEGKPNTTSDIISGGKTLNTFGADIPEDTLDGEEAEYGKNYSYHTPAGHIVEYNDTPGSERIMIRHKSGTGINIGPDGSVLVSSKRRVDVVNENHYISVAGNGVMTYEGNLTLNVSGDFNVNVGGEYKVTSTKQTNVTNGPNTRTVYGDDNHIIRGNQSTLTTGGATNTHLEGLNTIIKGDSRYAVEGSMTLATSQTLTMTSDREVVVTSKEANIAADNISVFGDQGTIGGENIVMYSYNSHVGHTVWAGDTVETQTVNASKTVNADKMTATEFVGDLTGRADTAIASDTANYATTAGAAPTGVAGAPSGWTNNTSSTADQASDTKATALPTGALLEDYRTKGSKGVKKVQIDPDNLIKDSIDLTTKTGGVSDRELTQEEVRAKMREPNNRNNKEFTAKAVSDGLLSPEYAKSSPPNIRSVKSTSSIVIQGQTPIGSIDPYRTTKRLKGV